MPLFSVARSSDAQMGRLLPGEPMAVPSPMARTARNLPAPGPWRGRQGPSDVASRGSERELSPETVRKRPGLTRGA